MCVDMPASGTLNGVCVCCYAVYHAHVEDSETCFIKTVTKMFFPTMKRNFSCLLTHHLSALPWGSQTSQPHPMFPQPQPLLLQNIILRLRTETLLYESHIIFCLHCVHSSRLLIPSIGVVCPLVTLSFFCTLPLHIPLQHLL